MCQLALELAHLAGLVRLSTIPTSLNVCAVVQTARTQFSFFHFVLGRRSQAVSSSLVDRTLAGGKRRGRGSARCILGGGIFRVLCKGDVLVRHPGVV
jgi:hypothetical protein